MPGNRTWRTAPPDASWYRRAGDGITLLCAVLGALPDADLLLHTHRTWSHSLAAVGFVGIFAAAMAANASRPIARLASMCAAAYGSHLLMDWLAVDRAVPRGVQLFWPFDSTFFISGWDLFAQVERRHFFTPAKVMINVFAVMQELAILTPIAVAVWLVRKKALARLSAELPGRDHSPQ